jgi:hypothetical protein
MKITQITRSSILDSILLDERPFHGQMDLIEFLKRIWDLSSMPSTDQRFEDAAGDIWQHMINNNDWTYQFLLCDRVDLLGSKDSVFLRFLETCLHPLAISDEQKAQALADHFNSYLEKDGYKIVVSERISGRPIFSAVDLGTARKVVELHDVYEVVLSFAGEDRQYVERVADYLISGYTLLLRSLRRTHALG